VWPLSWKSYISTNISKRNLGIKFIRNTNFDTIALGKCWLESQSFGKTKGLRLTDCTLSCINLSFLYNYRWLLFFTCPWDIIIDSYRFNWKNFHAPFFPGTTITPYFNLAFISSCHISIKLIVFYTYFSITSICKPPFFISSNISLLVNGEFIHTSASDIVIKKCLHVVCSVWIFINNYLLPWTSCRFSRFYIEVWSKWEILAKWIL